jgi:hypothetical protein
MKQYVKTYIFSALMATATYVATTSDASAQYCREYTQNINVGGRIQQGYSTACLQPDGSWQQTSGASYGEYNTLPTAYDQPVYEQPSYYVSPAPVYERRVTVVEPAPILPLFSINLGRTVRVNYDDDYRRGHHGRHDNGWHHGNDYDHGHHDRDDDRYSRHDDHDNYRKPERLWGERKLYVDRRAD